MAPAPAGTPVQGIYFDVVDIRSNRRDADGQSVITANRLLDGITVWRAADGSWKERIAESALVSNTEVEDLLSSLKGKAQELGLVGIYGVQVQDDTDGKVIPVTARERIRAFGPSVHPEFSPL
ncbi:DUF2849 domain-containing protein [Acetobacter aceti]|uniref:Uncharacterized protein n=1 Tax=Acetobacter aceti TaxID=435 RepID=A0A6S6PKW1_ACEAC|nr:DUF2849 domain-containing protein [Acetobacter aceti]BCI67650.1 hypothetical protein AAJCM20276_22740 [Acetobacter aceti]